MQLREGDDVPGKGRERGGGEDDTLRRIKSTILGDVLGEEDRLGDVKFKTVLDSNCSCLFSSEYTKAKTKG